MTVSRIFLSAACVLAFAAPAAAQMYPGQGVAVNPAATQGGRTIVYPDGTYVRLPPLLVPGQPSAGEPIHLHMPTEHRTRHRAVVRKETPPPDQDMASVPSISAPAPAAAPQPVARHTVRRAPPPPAPETTADTNTGQNVDTNTGTGNGAAETIPFSFGGPAPQQRPARNNQPAISQPHAEAQQHKARVAAVSDSPDTTTITRAPETAMAAHAPAARTVTHAPAQSMHTAMAPGEEGPDLSKRSEILFPHNATDPTPQSASELRELASDLNSALDAGARRVQLDAFGGAPGDKSSDARRVSLKRALVIRQLLINDGVPASRIDVRAMGGIDDSGNADRVDVYVRAG